MVGSERMEVVRGVLMRIAYGEGEDEQAR